MLYCKNSELKYGQQQKQKHVVNKFQGSVTPLLWNKALILIII